MSATPLEGVAFIRFFAGGFAAAPRLPQPQRGLGLFAGVRPEGWRSSHSSRPNPAGGLGPQGVPLIPSPPVAGVPLIPFFAACAKKTVFDAGVQIKVFKTQL